MLGKRRSSLASAPVVGTAALGGAEDDRTILYDLGWKEGIRDRALNGQGPKLPALDSKLVRAIQLTADFAPPLGFPARIPVTMAWLGDFTIAALPAELSTAAAQAIRAQAKREHGRFEIIGLANEYISYVASGDEYFAQDYMGASTIWGPQEAAFLACTVEGLRTQTYAPVSFGDIGAECYFPGPITHDFGPAFCGDARARPDEELETIVRNGEGNPERRLPWFVWEERARELGDEFKATAARQVGIWSRDDAGWLPHEGESESALLTMLLKPQVTKVGNAEQRRWAALWLHAPTSPPSHEYAFVVTRCDGAARCSEAFQIAALPPDGRIRPAADCTFLGVDPLLSDQHRCETVMTRPLDSPGGIGQK